MKQNYGQGRNTEEALLRKQEAMLKENGWVAHFVFDDGDFPNRTNYHTHGLADNFQHADLQICLHIQPKIAHGLFAAAVKNIKNGVVYQAGKEYDQILTGGFTVKFIEVQETDRTLLRMLIPDENGKYDAPFYREQLDTRQNSQQRRQRHP
jgi:Domain of unknown function (DUF4262)